MPKSFIQEYHELRIYQLAFESAMQVFRLISTFPEKEYDLLAKPMLQSARSICTTLAAAWSQRRYHDLFLTNLTQIQSQASTMQVCIEFAILCSYLDPETGQELYQHYVDIEKDALRLIANATAWIIPIPKEPTHESSHSQ